MQLIQSCFSQQLLFSLQSPKLPPPLHTTPCDPVYKSFFHQPSLSLSSLSSPQSKRRSQGLSLDAIYHCLNRTVLYQLSRPHKTVPQQVALLDALRVLTVNRNLVLGPGNHDQEFVSCLAHCFISLHAGR